MIVVDLHGFELAEALIEINYGLQECRTDQENDIEFIHGFHSGSVLQSYIRSPKFIAQMKREGFNLTRIRASNKGTTRFQLN